MLQSFSTHIRLLILNNLNLKYGSFKDVDVYYIVRFQASQVTGSVIATTNEERSIRRQIGSADKEFIHSVAANGMRVNN